MINEITAFLIGQFGKNDFFAYEVSGNEIMEYAFSVIYRVQELIGGRVVFVECQDKPKLVDFYVSNGFKVFRQDPEDRLLQLVCLIK